jgi:formyl-CoA transferase
LLTLLGPQVVDYDQLGIIQKRDGSRLPFTAPRNTYLNRDNKWVSISGSAKSTFERMCVALGIKELIYDQRFLNNRLRIKNSKVLDEVLQKAILNFDQENLIQLFDQFGAAIAACNNISEIFEDKHIKSRQNIIEINDEELSGPLKMQNVVGNFSRTPGKIKHAGPKLGQHNVEILMKELGFSKEELNKEGYNIND